MRTTSKISFTIFAAAGGAATIASGLIGKTAFIQSLPIAGIAVVASVFALMYCISNAWISMDEQKGGLSNKITIFDKCCAGLLVAASSIPIANLALNSAVTESCIALSFIGASLISIACASFLQKKDDSSKEHIL